MTAPVGRWEFPADIAGLARLQQEATTWLAGEGVAESAAGRILLALDEVAANIVNHAGLPAGEAFELVLERDDDGFVALFIDSGHPFDPTAHAAPAPAADLTHTPIGGFGLGLVRQLASCMEYRRADGRNQTSLRFGHAAVIKASGAPPAR